LAQRRADDISQAMQDEDGGQPDYAYLQDVYEQVGLAFSDVVVKRFEEVRAFHASIVSNRRHYLEREHVSALHSAETAQDTIRELDDERRALMRLLEEGGALETFQELQQLLGQTEGRLAGLRERRDAVQKLKDAQGFQQSPRGRYWSAIWSGF